MCFWTLGVAHQENSVLEKVQFALRVPSPLQQELGDTSGSGPRPALLGRGHCGLCNLTGAYSNLLSPWTPRPSLSKGRKMVIDMEGGIQGRAGL